MDQSEIKSFLKTFYSEATNMVTGWIEQFENTFGEDVGVVSKKSGGASSRKLKWNEDPSLQRSIKALEDKM